MIDTSYEGARALLRLRLHIDQLDWHKPRASSALLTHNSQSRLSQIDVRLLIPSLADLF